jgi:hypothetical protein
VELFTANPSNLKESETFGSLFSKGSRGGRDDVFFDAEHGGYDDSDADSFTSDFQNEDFDEDSEFEEDGDSAKELDVENGVEEAIISPCESGPPSYSESYSNPTPIVPCAESTGKIAEVVVVRRKHLPAPTVSMENISIMSILGNNVGKDLSTVAMPIALNEPLNLLQKLAEELEYCELLQAAADISDPVERMVHIAG